MKYTTYKSFALRDVLDIVVAAAIVCCTVCCWGTMPLILKIICCILSVVALVALVLAVDGLCTKRSTLAVLLFHVFKMIPIKDRRDPKVFQAYVESSSQPYKISEKVYKKYNMTMLGSYDDTYVIDRQKSKDGLVIFYIHGGGYWVRPYGIHFTMFNKLATMLEAKIVIPIYPLAPAHHADESNAMVFDRYMYLINTEKIDSKNIIFMGDSAGAGLALSLMEVLRDKGLPLPREAVLFSPWVDATNSTPGMDKIPDPFLNLPNLTYGGQIYAENLEGGAANPLASPINGNLKGLPKTTAFGGTYDSLNLDAERMSDVAAEQGYDYRIYVYPKMIHGYAGFFFTPEAQYAIRQVDNVVNGRPVENIVS